MADTVELDGTDVWLYTSPKAIYTDATLPSPYLHIAKPVGAGDDTHEYLGRTQVLSVGQGFRTGATTAAGRPDAAELGAGTMLYDTGLNKPIWSDGTGWRATGTAVWGRGAATGRHGPIRVPRSSRGSLSSMEARGTGEMKP